MKNIHKKVLALVLALVTTFSCASIAYAVSPIEGTDQYELAQEGNVSTRATGVAYEYKSSSFKDSVVRYFTSPVSGKPGILLAAAPTDGSTGTNVTATLYVKNVLGQYSEVVSYTVTANGKATTHYSTGSVNLRVGDQCMLTVVASNSNKTMVLVCQACTK